MVDDDVELVLDLVESLVDVPDEMCDPKRDGKDAGNEYRILHHATVATKSIANFCALANFASPGWTQGRASAHVSGYLAGIRGIFSSRTAACHAKVAMTMADCFSSSSLMRSG